MSTNILKAVGGLISAAETVWLFESDKAHGDKKPFSFQMQYVFIYDLNTAFNHTSALTSWVCPIHQGQVIIISCLVGQGIGPLVDMLYEFYIRPDQTEVSLLTLKWPERYTVICPDVWPVR